MPALRPCRSNQAKAHVLERPLPMTPEIKQNSMTSLSMLSILRNVRVPRPEQGIEEEHADFTRLH